MRHPGPHQPRTASTRVIILGAALVIFVLYIGVMFSQGGIIHEKDHHDDTSAGIAAQPAPRPLRRSSTPSSPVIAKKINEFDHPRDHHHHDDDDHHSRQNQQQQQHRVTEAVPSPHTEEGHQQHHDGETSAQEHHPTSASATETAAPPPSIKSTTAAAAQRRGLSPAEKSARHAADGLHAIARNITRPRAPLMKEEIVPGKVPAAWLQQQAEKESPDHFDDAALAEKFGDLDIVYTWVNGSEMMHRWKKSQIMGRMVGEANSRDRDSDELRHSLRSIYQHMRWHRGRITIVSPGHVPEWLDLTNPRVRVVHQDALILDEAERFTFDTNTIEQNLWRLPLLTDVFVQFNDDYFVMRDAPPSVFVNEHGGPIFLYENGVVNGGLLQVKKWLRDGGKIWIASVFHTHAAMSMLLPSESKSFRRYIKHAPFPMCRSYLQSLQQRVFPGAYHRAARTNRFRNHLDVLTPFVHNGFAFAAPDLLLSNRSLRRAQRQAMDKYPAGDMRSDVERMFRPLHDFDYQQDREADLKPCPPATWKSGDSADARLVVLKDDNAYNMQIIDTTLKGNYQFIAINDGFNNAALVSPLMRRYIDRWFPDKSGFESKLVEPILSSEKQAERPHTHPEALKYEAKYKKSLEKEQQRQQNEHEKKNNNNFLIRDDPAVLQPLHESLDSGDMGVILFASSCDGMCGSIRSASFLGFSRIKQRVAPRAPGEHEEVATTVTEPPTTTTPAEETEAGKKSSNKSKKKKQQQRLPLPPPPKDIPGLTTFFVVPAYHPHYHHKLARHHLDEAGQTDGQQQGSKGNNNNNNDDEEEEWNSRLVKALTSCHCPIGSYQHVDAEDVAIVPRIFQLRNDTVHIDTENAPVRPTLTRFATGRHEERNDVRLVVDDPEVLSAVVARARKGGRMPADSLNVMVMTTVDAVFGETVTAGHVVTALASDHRAGIVNFTPLPSSVAPQFRPKAGSGGAELSKSHVLLMPDHFSLSYLRTFPIPTERSFEIPRPKFLRFFLMSYRTRSLGLNPEFVRKQEAAHQNDGDHDHKKHDSDVKTHENGDPVEEKATMRIVSLPPTKPTTMSTAEPTTAHKHDGHEGDA